MYSPIDDLRPLLEPQERLERLIQATVRRFGRKVVDLSYANVYDGPPAEVRQALQEAAAEEGELCFQYSPYGGRPTVRRRIASRLSADYALAFHFRDVILTPGAMGALNIVLRTLFGPEQEVMLPIPCWHDYPVYLRNLGIPFRTVHLRDDKHLDLPSIAAGIGPRTRAILLSQPCCPTGVVYSREEIAALSDLLAGAERTFGTQIYLISDEVHRELIWSGRPFHSPLASHPRSLCIYSFGKVLALQGQRIGYTAVSPAMPERDRVREGLERAVRLMGLCTPTDLMQRAVCRLLDFQPRLDELAARQETVRAALRSQGYEVCEGDASFFVYARSPLPDDVEFADLMAAQGVLVAPSSIFHEPGYFRLSLTARWASIADGLPAFARAREQVESRSRQCSSRFCA
jgi:aspartate aminotransferase